MVSLRLARLLAAALACALLPAIAAAEGPVRSPLWVFSPDERIQVINTTISPYRRIVHLQSIDLATGVGGTCTGAFIGPNVILTAAHCLYDAQAFGGYAPQVLVYPARNGVGLSSSNLPYGFGYASRWAVPQGYVLYTPVDGTSTALSRYYDIGVVVMPDSTFGSRTGWFTVGSLSTETLARSDLGLTMAGYDGDKATGTMWTRFRSGVYGTPTSELSLLMSATHGLSGGPVWRSSDELLMGILQAGSDTVPSPNSARRVDASVLSFVDSVCVAVGCTYSSYTEPIAATSTPTPTATPTRTPTPAATATRTPTPVGAIATATPTRTPVRGTHRTLFPWTPRMVPANG